MEYDRPETMGRLSDRIYSIMKQEILSGRLKPGQHLPLEVIARNFGVSTTPVRDALSLLAADSIVEWRPRRGAYVAHLTPKIVDEVFQVREFLECGAISFAIAQGDTAAAEMKILAAQLASVKIEDRARHLLLTAQLEMRFHGLPIECVGNARLLEIYRSLSSVMTIAFILYPAGEERQAAAWIEHEAIADAIACGDAQAARDALCAHLHNSRVALKARLAGNDDPE